MNRLDKCKSAYSKESIEKDISTALSYQQNPKESQSFSLSAISKILYNLMAMMDKEGE